MSQIKLTNEERLELMVHHLNEAHILYKDMDFHERWNLLTNNCRTNQLSELPKVIDYLKLVLKSMA